MKRCWRTVAWLLFSLPANLADGNIFSLDAIFALE